MITITITQHAIKRCIERIPGIFTEESARAALSTKAIERAAQFGAKYVRLGTGQRVVIENSRIITVLPADTNVWKLGEQGDRRRIHTRGWVAFHRGAHWS